MLPGRSGIGAPESAFAGGNQNLPFGSQGDAVNGCDVGAQRRLLPGRTVVRRVEDVGAGRGNDQFAAGLDCNEIALAQHLTASPGLALVHTPVKSSRSRGQPALGSDFDVAYAS